MLPTLHFDINPVEGSVVRAYIQGTSIHIFLFITSMPAWIAGLMVSSVIPVPFPVMACVIQIIFYGLLGKIIRHEINFFVVAQKKHERQVFILDKIDDRIER